MLISWPLVQTGRKGAGHKGLGAMGERERVHAREATKRAHCVLVSLLLLQAGHAGEWDGHARSKGEWG